MFVLRLLTLGTFSLVPAMLERTAHVRGNQSRRYRNHRVANQDKHGRHHAPQRGVRCDIAIADGGYSNNRPIHRRIQRSKSIFWPFNQIHHRTKNHHQNGDKGIEQHQLMSGTF